MTNHLCRQCRITPVLTDGTLCNECAVPRPRTHSDVWERIGQIGLAILQADNAKHGNPDDWPTHDSTFDDLSASSKWSCVRVGLKSAEDTLCNECAVKGEMPTADFMGYHYNDPYKSRDYLAWYIEDGTTAIERFAAEKAAEVERLMDLLDSIPDELRKWWSFDNHQIHTHSYHSREDYIERLRARINAALTRPSKASESTPPSEGDSDE